MSGPVDLPPQLVESVAQSGRPEWSAWLAEVPRTVADLAKRWELRVGPAYRPGGVTSWVAPATRAGERVVVKVTWRGDPRDESRDEAEGLAVWAGDGAVRLLDRLDLDSTFALLLEVCEPGAALSSVPEPEQDVALCALLRRFWVRPPRGHAFRDLADMCSWWADEAQARGVGDTALTRDGLALFRSLPLDAAAATLLTTDLHAGNVLAAQREPWLMIDPKPYVGDPHYDALQHLLNCERLHDDPRGLVHRMAALLDLDADRLQQWLFARCVQESAQRADLLEVARRVAP